MQQTVALPIIRLRRTTPISAGGLMPMGRPCGLFRNGRSDKGRSGGKRFARLQTVRRYFSHTPFAFYSTCDIIISTFLNLETTCDIIMFYISKFGISGKGRASCTEDDEGELSSSSFHRRKSWYISFSAYVHSCIQIGGVIVCLPAKGTKTSRDPSRSALKSVQTLVITCTSKHKISKMVLRMLF